MRTHRDQDLSRIIFTVKDLKDVAIIREAIT